MKQISKYLIAAAALAAFWLIRKNAKHKEEAT